MPKEFDPQLLGYRKNVAVVVLNQTGEILACKRSDRYKTWQLPQGGVEQGETFEAALYRELEEEIGTNQVSLIGKLEDSIFYDWPSAEYYRGYRGQEQKYFLVRLNPGAVIDLSMTLSHEPGATGPELEEFQWVTAKVFLELISGFKAGAYRQAIEKLSAKYPDTIRFS